MKNDDLGNRMKTYYEEVSKTKLTRRMPVIIRLDGKAFHTFTRGFKRPFDELFMKTMQATMKYLCENIQGCVLGYTQSDEITLVLVDYNKLNTSAWFDYEVQKMASISASMATLAFNRYFAENVENSGYGLTSCWIDACTEEMKKLYYAYNKSLEKGALFDSRVFNIPKEEVVNCLLWRQLDAERNSILAIGQANFSHKELQNKSCKDIMNMLEAEGIVWGEYPTTLKRGSCCIKKAYFIDTKGEYVIDLDDTYTDPEGRGIYRKIDDKEIGTCGSENDTLRIRSHWIIDNEIPRFINEGREYIEKLIKY